MIKFQSSSDIKIIDENFSDIEDHVTIDNNGDVFAIICIESRNRSARIGFSKKIKLENLKSLVVYLDCLSVLITVSRGRPLGPGPDLECVCALGTTGM